VTPSLSHSPSVTAGEYRRLSTSRLQQHNQLYDQTASLYSPQETPVRYAESARANHFRFPAQGQDGLGLTQDSLDEVIMAIDMKRDGKIGAAYYNAMDETLVLEEDIPMGGIEAVETLLLRVQPTSIIIPNRAPTELVEFLERDAHRSNDNESGYGGQGAYILRNIASSQFDYDTSKDMLASLDIGPSKPDPVVIIGTNEESATSISSSKHHRLMRLAEKVNLDSCLAVGCAGALLNELERRRIAENPSPEGESDVAFRVRSVEMNTERMTLLLNADAMMSLQIVQSELHPNPQTRASNRSEPTAKETLSITGLLQALASSAQGKKTLRKMLLRPTTDIRLINERHKCIQVFLHSENRETANNMRKLLRKLKSTNTLLRHVSKGVDRIRGQLSVRIEDWKAVLRFAMAATQLKQAVQTLRGAENIPFLARVRQSLAYDGMGC
jgi:DNA mismatch repair protein MSH5